MNKKFKQNFFIIISIFCFYVIIYSIQAINSSNTTKSISNLFTHNKNKQIWTFYIGNYGNPEFDGKWVYWDSTDNSFVNETFIPYIKNPTLEMPEKGFYSSNDEKILNYHMKILQNIGIDAIIINWTVFQKENLIEERYTSYNYTYASHVLPDPKNYSGTIINLNSFPVDDSLTKIFAECKKFGIKAGILIPQTENRNIETIYNDVESFYRLASEYEVELLYNEKRVVFIEGFLNTHFDEEPENTDITFYISIINNQKDAVYSYDSFYDCLAFSPNNKHISSKFIDERNISFIPIVSPSSSLSYNSVLRYYNTRNIQYYQQQMFDAFHFQSDVIVIDSFNNWIKGTQIESSYSTKIKEEELDFISITKQLISDL